MVMMVCVWWPTWSGDSMNVSKLALPLLIPDLGQLGQVHLHRFISLTGRRSREKSTNVKDTSGNREIKGGN